MPVLTGADQQPGAQLPGYNEPDPDLKESAPSVPGPMEKTKELQLFMMAVRNQTSGSYAGSYGGTTGAYGIDANRWDMMARRAGLDGANMRDPAMQDYVAAWTMRALFAKYRNWNLVSLAWSNGEGAANKVIKASNKNPESVTLNDISKSYKVDAVWKVILDMEKLGWKGVTGEGDLDPTLGPALPTQVITGTGNVNVEDPYNATRRALFDERENEQRANEPSASEVLFQQIDAWSQSVAGGARADYRTDLSTVQAEKGLGSGTTSANELKPMKIEERE